MSQMPLVNAGRALANRALVRMLLKPRQPAFAATLASAEQAFSCSACLRQATSQAAARTALLGCGRQVRVFISGIIRMKIAGSPPRGR